MRFFKLKALSCSGKGNRVLRKSANEVYQEGAFHDPDAQAAKGFIYQTDAQGNAINKADAPAEAPKESDGPGESALAAAAAAAVGEPGDDTGADAAEESPIAGKTYKKFSKPELQELCAGVGIDFEEDDTKADLFEALEGHYGPADA